MGLQGKKNKMNSCQLYSSEEDVQDGYFEVRR